MPTENYCEKCKCIVSNVDEPDTIDQSMVYVHGCPECKKRFLPSDYSNIWMKGEKGEKNGD